MQWPEKKKEKKKKKEETVPPLSTVHSAASHWIYLIKILSNYNNQSFYHLENSVIVALQSDILTFYT